MRQLSPVNIETDEDSSNISNKRRKSSVTHIPPPAQFAGNDSDREKFRNEIPIEIDSDPESAPTSSNFKKPAFVPKPLPRNIVPKANSNNSLRRMLFKEGVSNPVGFCLNF